jgi:hypothetical protein
MEALAKALEAVDIDIVNPMVLMTPPVLDGSRRAKQRIIDVLYEEAKQLSSREMISLAFYVSQIMGNIEILLLDENEVDYYLMGPIRLEPEDCADDGEYEPLVPEGWLDYEHEVGVKQAVDTDRNDDMKE